MKTKDVMGFFYLSVDYDELFEGLTHNKGKNYGMFVLDSEENVLYETCDFEEKYSE